MNNNDGRKRVIIEGIRPQIDAGRFPIKRSVGDKVVVEADVFVDGHDTPSAVLRYRAEPGPQDRGASGEASAWNEIPMERLVNDRWRGEFVVEQVGTYLYTVCGWVDRFLTWREDLKKRVQAGQDVAVDLLIGAQQIEEATKQASGSDQEALAQWARRLRGAEGIHHLEQICEDAELGRLMYQWAPRRFATTFQRELEVIVDRPRGRCSAWYEMFPRSAASTPGAHGTLRDVQERLPYVSSMGFDVLYLPPIHPIGRQFRKGPNNAPDAGPDDVGSPWGIGAEEGGHKSIHPQLGTLEDFRSLVSAAHEHGIEIALDIALQCAPDHPYVKEHPEWFRKRPDGTIQYAENPPKKYQDIYPFDFETEAWQSLWEELKSIFVYWIDQGVKIFRVDNPHTKPFAFWEWLIGEIRRDWPDVIFLAEAFTRPKIMYRLAKLGFTQSYTYFSWRNTKAELTEYATELTNTDVCEFFRPNFWPNTPDILPEYLQIGGRPAFMARVALAATLSPNYGIYGPPFEHCWSQPVKPGSEEYLNSEKYQVHHHNLSRADSLKDFIARINRIRKEHSVLQTSEGLSFHDVDNDELICYSRSAEHVSEVLLVVVNLDPHHRQSGWVDLPLKALGLDEDLPYQLHDLLSGSRYLWHGRRNYVELNPQITPAHIFRLRRRVRTERDFEYFM